MKFSGSAGSVFRRIGSVKLMDTQEFRDASFQNASWWQIIVAPAQTVALYCNGYYVKWTFEGTIKDNNFAATFCGNRIGSGDGKRNIGGEATHHMTMYAYEFAKKFGLKQDLTGDSNIMFSLFPDYGVDMEMVDLPPLGDDILTRKHESWFVTMPDTGHRFEATSMSNGYTPEGKSIHGDKYHDFIVTLDGMPVGEVTVKGGQFLWQNVATAVDEFAANYPSK